MLKRLMLLLSFVLALPAAVQASPGPQGAAPEYSELSTPLPKANPDKIEVIEFFWYGCPHCYALEPFIEPWIKKLPGDVQFKRVPAMFNQNWAAAGRVYYTLEAMGLLDQLHGKLFDAIQQDHLRITDEGQLKDWLKRQNVDTDKFFATANSFAVEGRLKRASMFTQNAQPQLNGVPALVVDGRYLVSADVGSQKRMLEVADELIARARAGKGAPAKPAAPSKAAPAPSK